MQACLLLLKVYGETIVVTVWVVLSANQACLATAAMTTGIGSQTQYFFLFKQLLRRLENIPSRYAKSSPAVASVTQLGHSCVFLPC